MPHGNQSESECLLGGKIGKIGKIPGILRVYLEKPGYTRVIPALLHGFAPGTTPTAATTNENPAYHFRVPLYHTTPKLIKISPNTSLIPVKIAHCTRMLHARAASETERPWKTLKMAQIYDFPRAARAEHGHGAKKVLAGVRFQWTDTQNDICIGRADKFSAWEPLLEPSKHLEH